MSRSAVLGTDRSALSAQVQRDLDVYSYVQGDAFPQHFSVPVRMSTMDVATAAKKSAEKAAQKAGLTDGALHLRVSASSPDGLVVGAGHHVSQGGASARGRLKNNGIGGFVPQKGSASGRIPIEMQGAIKRQHHVLLLDKPVSTDIQKLHDPPLWLKGRYGLGAGKWGYMNERNAAPLTRRGNSSVKSLEDAGAKFVSSSSVGTETDL